jgi:four helix bundle protein
MRGGRHRNFTAYRLAASLSDRIHARVKSWPKFELWTVGNQLVRSADSIGANIAEGLGRGTRADQRRFLLVARGSLYETEHWLERAAARGLIGPDERFGDATAELGKVLSGLIATAVPDP